MTNPWSGSTTGGDDSAEAADSVDATGSAPVGVEPPPLPKAPEFERRPVFKPLRLAGLLLIAIPPLLAVIGLFGGGNRMISTASETVKLNVDYPPAQRFKVRAPLRISLTNLSDTALATTRVTLVAPYIYSFSDVAMTPSPDQIADGTYVFDLLDIAPGETRNVNMEMQAQRYWRAEGSVSWAVGSDQFPPEDAGSLSFSTFIWP